MKLLKNITLCLVLMMAVAVSTNAQDRLPDVTVKDMNGNEINMTSYGEDGKITVFTFWATWCAPCKKELNNIADLYDDWKEEYNVEVVAVNIDDQRNLAKVKPFVDGKGWEYTCLTDPNEALKRSLNFQTIPFTLVVDAEGDIVYEHSGYVEGDEYELEDFLKELNED